MFFSFWNETLIGNKLWCACAREQSGHRLRCRISHSCQVLGAWYWHLAWHKLPVRHSACLSLIAPASILTVLSLLAAASAAPGPRRICLLVRPDIQAFMGNCPNFCDFARIFVIWCTFRASLSCLPNCKQHQGWIKVRFSVLFRTDSLRTSEMGFVSRAKIGRWKHGRVGYSWMVQ